VRKQFAQKKEHKRVNRRYVYRKGDEDELTTAVGSIAEKTGIACTIETSISVDTCGIKIAIGCTVRALVSIYNKNEKSAIFHGNRHFPKFFFGCYFILYFFLYNICLYFCVIKFVENIFVGILETWP